jgi:drug/metabolite transporter (DMT)-like permease
MLTTPILVLVFSIFALGERLNFLKIIGIGLGLSGALMLTLLNSNVSTAEAPNPFLGNILVAVNAASYGVYLILIKPLSKKYHPVTVLKWNFGLGFLFVFPFGIGQVMDMDFAAIPFQIWLVIAFVLFFVTYIAYLLNGAALTIVSPSVVGAYIYLQPLLTGLIAVIGGHDTITWNMILAGLLIFGGVFLVSKR